MKTKLFLMVLLLCAFITAFAAGLAISDGEWSIVGFACITGFLLYISYNFELIKLKQKDKQ